MHFEDLIGVVFADRYILQDVLGEGGQAGVMVAWDQAEEKTVAIKILRPHLSDTHHIQRFEREGLAMEHLRSPNCVRVFAFGHDPIYGLLYIVMQLVEGQPLDLFIDFALTERQVVHIARGIALGLSQAHNLGIVHRDLKPENVVLSPQSRRLLHRPVVIDFGIAKFAQGYNLARLTATSKVIGTARYMSPEQIRGVELEGASDVYSIGILMYELITGDAPFHGTALHLMQAHLSQTPPPMVPKPSVQCPEALHDVVARCLSKDPTQRYGCGAELAEALRKVWSDLCSGQGPILATSLAVSNTSFTQTLSGFEEGGPGDVEFVVGFADGSIEQRSYATGHITRTWSAHESPVVALGWVDSGSCLVSVDGTGEVAAWDAPSGDAMHRLRPMKEPVTAVGFFDRAECVVLGTLGGNMRVFSVSAQEIIAEVRGHRGPINDLVVDPDGLWIASAGESGSVLVWDALTLELLNRFGMEDQAATAIDLDPGGQILVMGGARGALSVGWLDGHRPPVHFRAHAGAVSSVQIVGPSAHGQGWDVVSCGLDGEIRRWSLPQGTTYADAAVHPAGIRQACMIPDGSILAINDGLINRWDRHFRDPYTNTPDEYIMGKDPRGWICGKPKPTENA